MKIRYLFLAATLTAFVLVAVYHKPMQWEITEERIETIAETYIVFRTPWYSSWEITQPIDEDELAKEAVMQFREQHPDAEEIRVNNGQRNVLVGFRIPKPEKTFVEWERESLGN